MPLFLEPEQKYPVVLDCDKAKSPAPTFFAKSQSMRGQQRIAETLDRLTEAEVSTPQLFDETCERLGEVLVGWSNMGRDYSVDALRDVLSYQEARELLRKVMYNQHIQTDEKKS